MRKKYFHLHRAWFVGPLIPVFVLWLLLTPVLFYRGGDIKEVVARLTPSYASEYPGICIAAFSFIAVAFIFVLFARYSSQYLVVSSEGVEFHGRSRQKLNITFQDILEVGEINATDLGLNISRVERPAYYGYFDSDKLGRYKAYILDKNRAIYLIPKEGKGTASVFSCARPTKFVKAVEKKMHMQMEKKME